MSKEKKITVSKIILFVPYLFLIYFTFLFSRILFPMIETGTYDYSVIEYYGLEIMVPAMSLCAIAQTTYGIKSKAEYLANVMIYNISRLIAIQKENPEYQIYDSSAAKEDAYNATAAYEEQINEMNRNTLMETPSKDNMY